MSDDYDDRMYLEEEEGNIAAERQRDNWRDYGVPFDPYDYEDEDDAED